MKDDAEDLACKREMGTWLKDTKCRRLVLSQCMDGKDLSCDTLSGAIRCDNCNPNHDLVELWKKTKELSQGNLDAL